MEQQRRQQIHQLLEAAQETDNTDSEVEKTAVIGELLAELEKADRNQTSNRPPQYE